MIEELLFYCPRCQNRWRWPKSEHKHWQTCQVCGSITNCYEAPRSDIWPNWMLTDE